MAGSGVSCLDWLSSGSQTLCRPQPGCAQYFTMHLGSNVTVYPGSTFCSSGECFSQVSKGPLFGVLRRMHYPGGILDVGAAQFSVQAHSY